MREDLYTPDQLAEVIHSVITTLPQQFDMQTWAKRQQGADFCDTTLCLAGWAVTINGALPDFDPNERHASVETATYADGTTVNIGDEGARLLGIDAPCNCDWMCTCEKDDDEHPFYLDDDRAIQWLEEIIADARKLPLEPAPLIEHQRKELLADA